MNGKMCIMHIFLCMAFEVVVLISNPNLEFFKPYFLSATLNSILNYNMWRLFWRILIRKFMVI